MWLWPLTLKKLKVKGLIWIWSIFIISISTIQRYQNIQLKQHLNMWCYRGIYGGFPGLFWFPLPNSFLLKKIISNEYFPNLHPLFPIKCPWLLSMFFLIIRMQLNSFFFFNFVLSQWTNLGVTRFVSGNFARISLKETLKSLCILT